MNRNRFYLEIVKCCSSKFKWIMFNKPIKAIENEMNTLWWNVFLCINMAYLFIRLLAVQMKIGDWYISTIQHRAVKWALISLLCGTHKAFSYKLLHIHWHFGIAICFTMLNEMENDQEAQNRISMNGTKRIIFEYCANNRQQQKRRLCKGMRRFAKSARIQRRPITLSKMSMLEIFTMAKITERE